MFCFMFLISVPIILYSSHITEAEGEVGIPYYNTDRSKARLLLWFLTVTCFCCSPYLYFGSAIMLVT